MYEVKKLPKERNWLTRRGRNEKLYDLMTKLEQGEYFDVPISDHTPKQVNTACTFARNNLNVWNTLTYRTITNAKGEVIASRVFVPEP